MFTKTTRRGFLATSIALARQASRERLNVLLILVDDLGATDLACYGSRFYETPNIDRLAGEGMRFTQAYSACTVCSPSRAAILTGKYPARLHLTDYIPGTTPPGAKLKPPNWTRYLPLEEKTMADALHSAGYATASIGKWHLAPPSGDPAYYPDKRGFDLNLAGCQQGQPPSYFSPYGIPTLPDGPPGEYLTDREAAEAAKFIDSHADRPFFLYLPFHTVHTPLQAKLPAIEHYRQKARIIEGLEQAPQHNPTYAAMIDSLDENVGRLLRTLDQTGAAKRTVVILTSDNGGLLPSTNTNLGLRAGKGTAYEGGVRVPLIVRWPGIVKAGAFCETPVIGADLYPSVLEITGTRPEPGHVVDGASLVPLLRAGGRSPNWRRDELFWHYPHYHTQGATPYSALRRGPWRLIEFQEDGRTELYNLKQDPEEKKNLAAEAPQIAGNLLSRLRAWREEVGAQAAVPNPDYDPNRPNQRPVNPDARE